MSENPNFDFKPGAKSERLDMHEAVMSFTRRRAASGLSASRPESGLAALKPRGTSGKLKKR
jgi:hypothetical protein